MSLKDWMKKVETLQLHEASQTVMVPGIKPGEKPTALAVDMSKPGANVAAAALGAKPGQAATALSPNSPIRAVTPNDQEGQLTQQTKPAVAAQPQTVAGTSNPALAETEFDQTKSFSDEVEVDPQPELNEGLRYIKDNHKHECKMYEDGWGLDESLYGALVDHYYNEGKIPRKLMIEGGQALRDFIEGCYAKDTGMAGNQAAINNGMLDEEDVAEGSKEDFTMNARQADPRIDRYATDPKPSVVSQIANKAGNTLKTGFNKVMNKLHPSDEELRKTHQTELEETSELERSLRRATKDKDMFESKKTKKAVEEAVEKTKTGRIHKADAGGYGRVDDEEDTDEDGKKIKKVKKDEPKKGRGRPKKTDNASGEDKKFDFSAFGVQHGKDIKLKPWDKKKTTVKKIATKADREEVDEAKLKGKQSKLDINKNGKLDGGDFSMMSHQKKKKDAQMESWGQQLKMMLSEDMSMTAPISAPAVIPKNTEQQNPASQGADMNELLAILQNAGVGQKQQAPAATPTPNAAGGDELDGSELQSGVDGPVNDKNSEPGSNDPRNDTISGQVFVPQLAMPRGMGMSVEGDVHTHEIDVKPQGPDEVQVTLAKEVDDAVVNGFKDLISRISGGNTRDGEAKLIVPYGDYSQEDGGETARDHQDLKQPNASVGVQGADDEKSINHVAGTGGGILPANLEEDLSGTFEEEAPFGHQTTAPGQEPTNMKEEDMSGTFEEAATFGHQTPSANQGNAQMQQPGNQTQAVAEGGDTDAEIKSLVSRLNALLGKDQSEVEEAKTEKPDYEDKESPHHMGGEYDNVDSDDEEEESAEDREDRNDDEKRRKEEDEKVDESAQPCNECGLSESMCECAMSESKLFTNLLKMFEAAKPDFTDVDKDGDKKESWKKAESDKKAGKKADKKDSAEKLDEWANSPQGSEDDDESFVTDMEFMTKVINGGVNKEKSTGQATTPVIASQTDRQGEKVSESLDVAAQMRKLAGIR